MLSQTNAISSSIANTSYNIEESKEFTELSACNNILSIYNDLTCSERITRLEDYKNFKIALISREIKERKNIQFYLSTPNFSGMTAEEGINRSKIRQREITYEIHEIEKEIARLDKINSATQKSVTYTGDATTEMTVNNTDYFDNLKKDIEIDAKNKSKNCKSESESEDDIEQSKSSESISKVEADSASTSEPRLSAATYETVKGQAKPDFKILPLGSKAVDIFLANIDLVKWIIVNKGRTAEIRQNLEMTHGACWPTLRKYESKILEELNMKCVRNIGTGHRLSKNALETFTKHSDYIIEARAKKISFYQIYNDIMNSEEKPKVSLYTFSRGWAQFQLKYGHMHEWESKIRKTYVKK